MIKFIFIFNLIFFITINTLYGNENDETEITTEGGIEVFQDEKYYLLKENVIIKSDELNLKAQTVKIFFEKDLYDIQELIAKDKVEFNSKEYNVKGNGENLRFNVKNQNILINGNKSQLYLENTEMLSDKLINVDNLNGSFLIEGVDSKLINENIYISGSKIEGTFEIIDGKRDISNLFVEDKNMVNIRTDNILMSSKKAIYNKNNSIIELFEDVKINRGNEIITGDYGILDTNKNSYKVSSNNSNKVKAIILNSDE